MKRLLVIIAVMSACMPGLSRADVLKMQPGLWEIVVNMHMTGLPVAIPAQVLKKCLTAEDMKNTENSIMQPQNLPGTKQQCKINKLSHTGNAMSWQGSCTGDGDITFSGTMNFDGADHYTGNMNVQGNFSGHQMQMSETMEGHRIAVTCTP
ncbi:MAG: DUF3617 domain-containing protein [Gammaproteobacteria bacterium]